MSLLSCPYCFSKKIKSGQYVRPIPPLSTVTKWRCSICGNVFAHPHLTEEKLNTKEK